MVIVRDDQIRVAFNCALQHAVIVRSIDDNRESCLRLYDLRVARHKPDCTLYFRVGPCEALP